MSGREWKPGDVALVRATWGPESRAGEPHEYVASRNARGWVLLTDCEEAWWDGGDAYGCVPIRPLVVIDPADAGAVDHLLAAYYQSRTDRPDGSIGRMRAALRSLIEPPKPDEPTGLGAVIEAGCRCEDEPHRFVRDPAARDFSLAPGSKAATGAEVPWVSGCGHHNYDQITAVRVLSEGVSDV